MGMFFGAIIMSLSADKSGRKPIFQFTLFLTAFFGILSAFSPSIDWFIIWRGLMGVGFGGHMVVNVTLLSEYLPVKKRGFFVILLGAFFGVGSLVSALLSYLFIPRMKWNYMVAISALPIFFVLLFRNYIQESMRYLLIRNESQVVTSILQDMAHENGATNAITNRVGSLVLRHNEIEDIDEVVETGVAKLFSPFISMTTNIFLFIWFIVALAGSLFFWLPLYVTENETVKSGHVLVDNVYKAAILMAVGDIVGGVVFAFASLILSRRALLRVMLLGMGIFSVAIGCMETKSSIFLSFLPVVGALRSGITNVLYAVTPEVFPTSIRCAGVGFCAAAGRLAPTASHWLVTFLLGISFLHATSLFATLYFIAFTVSFMIPHDTKDSVLGRHYYEDIGSMEDEELVKRF